MSEQNRIVAGFILGGSTGMPIPRKEDPPSNVESELAEGDGLSATEACSLGTDRSPGSSPWRSCVQRSPHL